MKPNKNAEQVAVVRPLPRHTSEFSHNYNLNIFVKVRPLGSGGYAMTLIKMKNHLFIKGVLAGIVLSSIFVLLYKPYKRKEIIKDAIQNYGLPPINIGSVTYAYNNNVFGADWYGFKATAKDSDAAEWRKEVEKLYNQKQLLDDVEIEWISSPGDPLDIEMKLSDMNK